MIVLLIWMTAFGFMYTCYGLSMVISYKKYIHHLPRWGYAIMTGVAASMLAAGLFISVRLVQ